MEKEKLEELNKRKKWLKSYRRVLGKIDRLETKLLVLDEKIYSVRSPKLSDLPRGGQPVELSDLLSEKEELKDRINKLASKSRDKKSEILDKLDDLEDDRYSAILEDFFIECKSFEEIAEDKGYTVRHVIRLYSEGILALDFESL